MSSEQPAAPPSLTRTVIRGVGLAGSGYALSQALTLAAYLVLARLVTPHEFGIYAAAAVIVTFGQLFTESGMLAALVQRKERIEEAANTALIATVLGGLGLALVVIAIAPLWGTFFGNHAVTSVTAAMSGTLVIGTATIVPDALLLRRFSFIRRTIVEPLATIAFAVGAILAASKGLGAWSLVIGQYAHAAVAFVLTWGLARWRPHPRMASFGLWRELAAYGRHVITAGFVLRVGDQADNVLVGRFLGESSLGQYTYAYRIAATPYMAMLAAVSYVLFPAFSRISAERDRFHTAFRRALGWVAALGFPMGLILLPLGLPATVLIFGDVWRPAGEAVMAMCLFGGANSLASVCLEASKAVGRPDVLLRVHGFSVVLTIILIAAMLPVGLVGVAAAVSLGAVASAIMSIRALDRTVGVPPSVVMQTVRAPLLASLAMVAVLLPLELIVVQADQRGTLVGLALLAAEAGLGLAVYTLVLARLSPLARARLKMLLLQAWRALPREGIAVDSKRAEP